MDSSCITPSFRGDIERKLRGKKSSAIFLQKKKGRIFGDGPGHSLREREKLKYIWNLGSGQWLGQLVRSLKRKRMGLRQGLRVEAYG